MFFFRLSFFIFLIQVFGVFSTYIFKIPNYDCTNDEVFPLEGCNEYIQCRGDKQGEVLPCPQDVLPKRLELVCRKPTPTTTTATTTTTRTPGGPRLQSNQNCIYSLCPTNSRSGLDIVGFSAPNNATSPYYAVCFNGEPSSFAMCKKQLDWESYFDESRGKCVTSCDSSNTNKVPYGNDCRQYLECVRGRGVILRTCTPLFHIDGRCVDRPDYQCTSSSTPTIPISPVRGAISTARTPRPRPIF